MQQVMTAKAYIVRTLSGKEFEIEPDEARRLMTRFKGARAGSWWQIQGGPGVDTIIALNHIEYIMPKRTKDEEKKVVKAQKDEHKKKLIRIENVKNKQASLDNQDNKDIDSCDVLHQIQNTTDEDGERSYVVDKEHIVPRYEVSGQDVKRYFPICKKCGWRGQLIKGTLISKIWGIEPEEVIPYGE